MPAAPAPAIGHQINVQQRDCTLVVNLDGSTFLIDAGNVGKGSAEIVPYLQRIGNNPVDRGAWNSTAADSGGAPRNASWTPSRDNSMYPVQ